MIDASVIYTYRYDENCANIPQTNPRCPDFVMPEIPEVEAYDPLDDDAIQDELDRDRVAKGDEDQEDRDRKKSKDEKDRDREMIEVLLGTTNTTATGRTVSGSSRGVAGTGHGSSRIPLHITSHHIRRDGDTTGFGVARQRRCKAKQLRTTTTS